MNHVKFGLGFVLILAMILAASSIFFGGREEPEPPEMSEILEGQQPEPVSKTQAQEVESIATERGISEQSLDGELNTTITEEEVEEPESNLESVFMNLTQEMARRGYAQGLSECIEGQFRENQGIENPKDLDAMLQTCEGEFKVGPQQRQQIRDVVLQAIAKAQNRPEDLDKTSVH
ncbi:hypothetical protein [Oligoflexus tunisiensis]|uniref:hypothetical protein n=1 Tax=Oligoflexus tunisiensis TaxID=708132 RepID=UPI00159F139E|nr:hypothetical protein [Oligoflexus tunisiensis]